MCKDLSAFAGNQGSEWLSIEAGIGKAQAAIHTVSSELQGLLANVVLKVRLGRGLHSLHELLHTPPPLHQHPDLRGQDAWGLRGVGKLQVGEILQVWGTAGMVNCGEANVELLYDRWVQTVEVQKDNKAIVEPSLRFQHQAPSVGWLPTR